MADVTPRQASVQLKSFFQDIQTIRDSVNGAQRQTLNYLHGKGRNLKGKVYDDLVAAATALHSSSGAAADIRDSVIALRETLKDVDRADLTERADALTAARDADDHGLDTLRKQVDTYFSHLDTGIGSLEAAQGRRDYFKAILEPLRAATTKHDGLSADLQAVRKAMDQLIDQAPDAGP